MKKRVSVYRCMNSAGDVIYIGMSRSIVDRFVTHQSASTWLADVSGIHVDLFDCEITAARSERDAIALLRPKHNTPSPSMSEIEQMRISKRPETAGLGRPAGITYTLAQANAMIRLWHDDNPRRMPKEVAALADTILGLEPGTIKPHWVRDLVIKFVGTAQRDKPEGWTGISTDEDGEPSSSD